MMKLISCCRMPLADDCIESSSPDAASIIGCDIESFMTLKYFMIMKIDINSRVTSQLLQPR